MIEEIKIENYRCFKEFHLKDLKRVNLLVGKNNSGKTSILEGLNILKHPGNLNSLAHVLKKRDEYFDVDHEFFSINNLFNNFEFSIGDAFSFKCIEKKNEDYLISSIVSIPQSSYYDDSFDNEILLDIDWSNDNSKINRKFEIGEHGSIPVEALSKGKRDPQNSIYIPSSSYNMNDTISLLEEIILTDEEELVIDILRIIEPSIQKIAVVDGGRSIVAKCSHIENRIRIKTFGEGIWHLLTLSMALVKSKNGTMIVDEIDTGLHFSVMKKMWELLLSVSERFNVQVFATTHSNDCIQSLASVIAEQPDKNNDSVSIQRIEADKIKSVSFTEKEIIAAAKNDIEVR